jgi:hypothetical protein
MAALLTKSDGCYADIAVAERICFVLWFLFSFTCTYAAAENYCSGETKGRGLEEVSSIDSHNVLCVKGLI